MPGKIFVNYRREDERAMAARMRDRLAGAFGSSNVFMDVDNLMAGQRFDKELEKALAMTDVFIAVIGPRWLDLLHARRETAERDYVCEEIAGALKRGLVVIPVLIEQATLPRADALPEDLRDLVLHQKHVLTHEQFGRDVASLLEAIRFARSPKREGRQIPDIPWAWITLTAVVIAVAGWIVAHQLGLPVWWPFESNTASLSPSEQELAEAARKSVLAEEARKTAETAKADEKRKAEAEAQQKAAAEAQKQKEAERLAAAKVEAERKQQQAAAESQKQMEAERQRLSLLQTREAEESAKQVALRRPGREFRDCPECPEMVVIPAGEFMMGSAADEAGREPDEGPVHRVSIAALAIGKYAVTRGEFTAFVRDSGYATPGPCNSYNGKEYVPYADRSWRDSKFKQTDRHPVVCLNWYDAKAYVDWLATKTGKPYRLLTEAEHEYGARAQSTTKFFFGNDARDLCRHANGADQAAKMAKLPRDTFADCSDGYVQTAPVGSFPANGFGLFDMIGNAWTWVADCKNQSYDGAPSDGSAWTAGECSQRSIRGASWFNGPDAMRSAERAQEPATQSLDLSGVRVALSLGQ